MSLELDDIWLEKMEGWKRFSRPEKRRLYRVLLVGAIGVSYLIDTLLLSLFTLAGTIDPFVTISYGLAGLGHVVIFSLLHWSGFSERFANPHMTQWGMIYAIGVQMGGILIAPQLTHFFLGIMFIIFSFGILRVTLRSALMLWALGCLLIAVVIGLSEHKIMGMAHPNVLELLTVWLSFSLILLRVIALGYYATALRMRLYKMSHSLEQAKNQAEHLAAHDPLTGVLTRRALAPYIDEQIIYCQSKASECCVAMVDLDHFKKINDRLGHLAGDGVLKALVKQIKDHIRAQDRLSRYGGEEFLLLLPNSGIEQGMRLMERIRATISTADWQAITPQMSLTVSCGVTTINRGDTVESIISRADKALYQAKSSGRNRVCQA